MEKKEDNIVIPIRLPNIVFEISSSDSESSEPLPKLASVKECKKENIGVDGILIDSTLEPVPSTSGACSISMDSDASRCAVPSCDSTSNSFGSKIHFFPLPEDKEVRKQWLMKLNIHEREMMSQNKRICMKHFKSSMLRKVVYYEVKHGAVPEKHIRVEQTRRHLSEMLKKNTNILKNNFKNVKEKKRIDKDLRYFALNLHLGNPIAYKFLKSFYKLPSLKRLSNTYIPIVNQFDELHKSIKAKLDSLPKKAKYCALHVERVILTEQLFYEVTTDKIIGVETIGEIRTPNKAEYAYIIIIKGLDVDWEQPVVYSFFGSHTIYLIHIWLCDTINNLTNMGFDIKAVVLDSHNDIMKNVYNTMDKQRRNHTDNACSYNPMFDIIGLLTNLMHHFIKQNFVVFGTSSGDKKVHFSHIQQVLGFATAQGVDLKVNDLVKTHQTSDNIEKLLTYFGPKTSELMNIYLRMGLLLHQDSKHTNEVLRFLNKCLMLGINNTPFNQSNELKDLIEDPFLANDANIKNNMMMDETFQRLKLSLHAMKNIADASKDKFNCHTERLSLLSTRQIVKDITYRFAKIKPPTPIQFVRAYSCTFLRCLLNHSKLAVYRRPLHQLLKNVSDMKHFNYGYKRDECFNLKMDDNNHQIKFGKSKEMKTHIMKECFENHVCIKSDGVVQYYDEFVAENIKVMDGIFESVTLQLPTDFIAETFIEKMKTADVMSLKAPCPCFPRRLMMKIYARIRIYQLMVANNRSKQNYLLSSLNLKILK